METYYHQVRFDFTWWDDFNDREEFELSDVLFISHEVLMALIQGGQSAQCSWIKSHWSGCADKIYNITMYYNLSKKYTQDGKLLEDNSTYNNSQRNTTTSSSVARTVTPSQSNTRKETPPTPSQSSKHTEEDESSEKSWWGSSKKTAKKGWW